MDLLCPHGSGSAFPIRIPGSSRPNPVRYMRIRIIIGCLVNIFRFPCRSFSPITVGLGDIGAHQGWGSGFIEWDLDRDLLWIWVRTRTLVKKIDFGKNNPFFLQTYNKYLLWPPRRTSKLQEKPPTLQRGHLDRTFRFFFSRAFDTDSESGFVTLMLLLIRLTWEALTDFFVSYGSILRMFSLIVWWLLFKTISLCYRYPMLWIRNRLFRIRLFRSRLFRILLEFVQIFIINFAFVFLSCKCYRLYITTSYKLYSWFFEKLSIFVEIFASFISFQSSFVLNSFRIRSYPDLKWFFPDPDPAKSFGSDRIRIHNTDVIG